MAQALVLESSGQGALASMSACAARRARRRCVHRLLQKHKKAQVLQSGPARSGKRATLARRLDRKQNAMEFATEPLARKAAKNDTVMLESTATVAMDE